MQLCTIFSATNPRRICHRRADFLLPLAIGQNARMRSTNDALLLGYMPVCAHHAEYIPPALQLTAIDAIIEASFVDE